MSTDPIALDLDQHVRQDNPLESSNNLCDSTRRFKFMDSLLYHEELLYVLDGKAHLRILEAQHDFPIVRHFGFNKTMELISCDFWWPQMWKTIKRFVQSCNICLHSKTP